MDPPPPTTGLGTPRDRRDPTAFRVPRADGNGLENTTLYLHGYKYAQCGKSMRKIKYRCSKYRKGCKDTMEFSIELMGYITMRGHTCRPNASFPLMVAEDEMKQVTDQMAIVNASMLARQIWEIWEIVRQRFYGIDTHAVRGLSEEQVIWRVYQARSSHYSGDVHGSIVSTSLIGRSW